jgi:hypothetical protein
MKKSLFRYFEAELIVKMHVRLELTASKTWLQHVVELLEHKK